MWDRFYYKVSNRFANNTSIITKDEMKKKSNEKINQKISNEIRNPGQNVNETKFT